MSQRQTMIILNPGSRIHKEAFVAAPMACPYCGGRGWHHTGMLDPETEVCPDCEGTGEVIAVVTIDWKPNKR